MVGILRKVAAGIGAAAAAPVVGLLKGSKDLIVNAAKSVIDSVNPIHIISSALGGMPGGGVITGAFKDIYQKLIGNTEKLAKTEKIIDGTTKNLEQLYEETKKNNTLMRRLLNVVIKMIRGTSESRFRKMENAREEARRQRMGMLAQKQDTAADKKRGLFGSLADKFKGFGGGLLRFFSGLKGFSTTLFLGFGTAIVLLRNTIWAVVKSLGKFVAGFIRFGLMLIQASIRLGIAAASTLGGALSRAGAAGGAGVATAKKWIARQMKGIGSAARALTKGSAARSVAGITGTRAVGAIAGPVGWALLGLTLYQLGSVGSVGYQDTDKGTIDKPGAFQREREGINKMMDQYKGGQEKQPWEKRSGLKVEKPPALKGPGDQSSLSTTSKMLKPETSYDRMNSSDKTTKPIMTYIDNSVEEIFRNRSLGQVPPEIEPKKRITINTSAPASFHDLS